MTKRVLIPVGILVLLIGFVGGWYTHRPETITIEKKHEEKEAVKDERHEDFNMVAGLEVKDTAHLKIKRKFRPPAAGCTEPTLESEEAELINDTDTKATNAVAAAVDDKHDAKKQILDASTEKTVAAREDHAVYLRAGLGLDRVSTFGVGAEARLWGPVVLQGAVDRRSSDGGAEKDRWSAMLALGWRFR